MIKANLLIAEDDTNLGQILKEYLEIKGFNADLAGDGEAAFKLYKNNVYDLCILDIMMPKKDGFTLAREIKSTSNAVPLIFLTAKSLKEDTIEGLKIGADDYITKPFSMEELLLRIHAILRRSNSRFSNQDNSKIKIGELVLNFDQQVLISKNEKISLTSKESELLKLLVQYKNQILDRSLALKLIWNDDSYFNARSMDVYIAKLRKHLKADSNIQIITIHGKGFKLVDSN
jgi:DNA-binding response OmpR family regulator